MSELEPEVLEQEVVAEPELTEVEQEAMQHGWTPEGVEGKRNLSAEEFMDRQPLYDDIRSLKKQTRKQQEAIDAMRQMQEGIRKRAAEEAIAKLNAQKKTALENENYDQVIAIDDEIAAQRASESAPETQTNIAFEQWVDENEWYTQDADMKQYADIVGAGYYQQNQNRSTQEVYDYVTKEVKKHFPEKFGNVNRTKPSSVEGATKGRTVTSPKSKHSIKELPDSDIQIMKTLLRTTNMTEAEYLKDYFGE